MPVYTYACETCGKKQDWRVSMEKVGEFRPQCHEGHQMVRRYAGQKFTMVVDPSGSGYFYNRKTGARSRGPDQ